ncbi:MAG: putative O-glycosylation ligase, exosortase A system-associated [Betaproteobacteria bacterium]|nr:putative O-glycosylation ligase, exosortase A system-associated [Betaproteobacteria bacterium]
MRDIVLTIFIFSLLPSCFMRPWFGVLVWSWIGFMNPHKLCWGFAQTMPFAMMVGIATLVGLVLSRDKKSIPWSRELVVMLVLLTYFTFTTFFAWAPPHAWPQWEKVVKVFLMVFVTTMVIFGKKRIHALLLVIAFSIGFYGVKGAIFTVRTGGHDEVWGPMGTFIGSNTFLGLAMIMVLPLLVFLAREEERVWMRRLLYATATCTFVSIIFTYSRGAFLGLAAISPLLFLRTKHKALVSLLLVPMLFFGAQWAPKALFHRADTIEHYHHDYSAMQRLQAWSVAWNVARTHPFTGGGFEYEWIPNRQWLSYADPIYNKFGHTARAAHSIYFQVMGQHGFVAFGLFILLLVWALISLTRLQRLARLVPEAQWIGNYAMAIQIGIVGYMVAGAFLASAYFDLMWAYIGLTAILRRELAIVTARAPAKAPATTAPARRGGRASLALGYKSLR